MTSPSYRNRARLVAPAFATVLASVLAACYDYLPVTPTAAALPQHEVELALTDSGSVIEAHAIGPASTAIDGMLVGDSSGSYVVAVRQVRHRDADPAPWRGERVTVPHALVSSVRERRLSAFRTTVASVGAVVGVVLARAAIRGIGGSNSGKSGSGPVTGPK